MLVRERWQLNRARSEDLLIDAGNPSCLLPMQEKILAAARGLQLKVNESWHRQRLIKSNSKNVILMDTNWNLVPPKRAASKLVWIAPFGEQEITITQLESV